MFDVLYYFFFFFQAEDGIRDHCVTGVQTCALPICRKRLSQRRPAQKERGSLAWSCNNPARDAHATSTTSSCSSASPVRALLPRHSRTHTPRERPPTVPAALVLRSSLLSS